MLSAAAGLFKLNKMHSKDNKKTGTSPVKDLNLPLEKHQRAIEQLNVLVAQKERYLQKGSSRFIRRELQILYTVIVNIAEGMKDYTAAYNDLSSAYMARELETNAIRYALPENRSSLCMGREIYALRYQIAHKKMPERKVLDSIREKVDRFEKRMSMEENAV